MKCDRLVSGLILGVILLVTPVFAQNNVQRLNTDGIAKAMGKEGELIGEMYKVSFPRSDLTVNVKNVAIKPALALIASEPETKPEIATEIERIIGYRGSMGGDVFHITVPRNEVHVMTMGTMLPSSMGMNTPFNFQLDGKNAAISGDFMLLPAELNPVINALRANGIEVASIHNHLLDNQPSMVFMHFWAYGDAVSLAKGLKAALDRTAS